VTTDNPVPEVVRLEPMQIRAVMARRGIAPMHLQPWWSPDTERDMNPFDDPETQVELRGFLSWLWTYCLQAEGSAP
jgi:hypothetical protein